ncbi:glutamate ligase domain-containing protein [Streptomyces sp. NPDC017638]|uniref:glutamate ligase domain-containing protein n=1 Tax=Streptomyces sp. NPDC017638 TaxID=3365004 RepID=UPI00378AFE2F
MCQAAQKRGSPVVRGERGLRHLGRVDEVEVHAHDRDDGGRAVPRGFGGLGAHGGHRPARRRADHHDAFNANPDSMKAAFRALQCMTDGRRTTAVLGETKELGADGGEEHRQVGRLVAAAGIHLLTAAGSDDAQTMAGAAAQQDDPRLNVVGTRDRDHTLSPARELPGAPGLPWNRTRRRRRRPGRTAGDCSPGRSASTPWQAVSSQPMPTV